MGYQQQIKQRAALTGAEKIYRDPAGNWIASSTAPPTASVTPIASTAPAVDAPMLSVGARGLPAIGGSTFLGTALAGGGLAFGSYLGIKGLMNGDPIRSGFGLGMGGAGAAMMFPSAFAGLPGVATLAPHLGALGSFAPVAAAAIPLAGAGIGGGLMISGIKEGKPLKSTIGGGMAGASIGFMAGGPVGAAIGGAIGGIGGLIGGIFGKKKKKKLKKKLKKQKKIYAQKTNQIREQYIQRGMMLGYPREVAEAMAPRIEMPNFGKAKNSKALKKQIKAYKQINGSLDYQLAQEQQTTELFRQQLLASQQQLLAAQQMEAMQNQMLFSQLGYCNGYGASFATPGFSGLEAFSLSNPGYINYNGLY